MLPLFEKLKINIFGTSHSSEIRLEVEGFPKGEKLDLQRLQEFADRRKSRDTFFSTPRKEADKVEILSGVSEEKGCCKTDGKPFVAIVKNADTRRSDYSCFKTTPRPGHADYAALLKYGKDIDLSGGGQFSGRMTLPLVIAGGVAAQILANTYGTQALSYASEIGGVEAASYLDKMPSAQQILAAQKKEVPSLSNEEQILAKLKEIAAAGDSAGGVVECVVFNPPLGIGGPFTFGIESRISALLYSVPSVKGVEFGSGFRTAKSTGSVTNDPFYFEGKKVVAKTNHNGGINGGISNGMPITVRAAFKPVPSISKEQNTVNLETGLNDTIKITGRHDICIVPRALVCVEAAVTLAMLDCLLSGEKK